MDCFRTIIAKWVCSWTLSKRCGRVMITTQWLGCQLENSVSAHSSVIFDLRFWPLTGGKFFCSLQCVFLLERVLAVYVEPAQTLSLYNTRTHTHTHTRTHAHMPPGRSKQTLSPMYPHRHESRRIVYNGSKRGGLSHALKPHLSLSSFFDLSQRSEKWCSQNAFTQLQTRPSFLPSFIPSLQVVQTVCGTLECVFIYI